jgi:hypothetical protein
MKDSGFGTKYKYFDVEGLPARMLALDKLPELFIGREWIPLDSTNVLRKAIPIDEAGFHRLVALAQEARHVRSPVS